MLSISTAASASTSSRNLPTSLNISSPTNNLFHQSPSNSPASQQPFSCSTNNSQSLLSSSTSSHVIKSISSPISDEPPSPPPPTELTTEEESNTNTTTTPNRTLSENEVPAVDRPSHVSVLGGKYLLISNTGTTGTPQLPRPPQSKTVIKCICVETRQQFLCKIVPRNLVGLGLLTAYHKLEEFGDVVSPIHEIIMSPKFFYLVFPPNYGNVHAYLLAKKRLREGEAAHLFKQMVQAVQHCHSKGIILRDLKLGKFVFTDKERTKIKLECLEDAVVLTDESDDGLCDKHGCPNYVSPEKAEILRTNSKYPGKATDIWGLGVMLYTMLVGRYPFNDTDHSKLFVKIRRGLFSIPETLSTNVKCVIRCLLRREPDGRLSCEQILRHPWIRTQTRPSSPSLNNSNNNNSTTTSGTSVIVTNNNTNSNSDSSKSRGEGRRSESDDQVVPEFWA